MQSTVDIIWHWWLINGCTWSVSEIILTGENWGTQKKLIATLSTTNHIWTDLGLNPDLLVKGQWLIAWAMAQTTEITENVPSNNKSYVWITFTAASISYHHMNAMQYTFKHSWFYKHIMQGKGNIFTVYTMKTYWWIRGTVPLIHSLSTIRRWGVHVIPQLLQTQERTLVPNI